MPVELKTDDAAIGNNGERVTVANTLGYWAHLSIYHQAIQFSRGTRVLDVGSGSGYGSAYLARHGATEVVALEGSAEAVDHSRLKYAAEAVTFRVADLNEPLPCESNSFPFVFSSNVFEHVANIDGLVGECARVVTADGRLLVAVPPIWTATDMAGDMQNEFHVHHIPPTAWRAKLLRFFEVVQTHWHFPTGRFAEDGAFLKELALPPEQVTIRETDFKFPLVAADDVGIHAPTMTAMFLCTRPRVVALPETIAERAPAAWAEGAAAAKLIGSARAEAAEIRRVDTIHRTQAEAEWHRAEAAERLVRSLQQELQAALAEAKQEAQAALAEAKRELLALQKSTSWRLTAPLRWLVNALRSKR